MARAAGHPTAERMSRGGLLEAPLQEDLSSVDVVLIHHHAVHLCLVGGIWQRKRPRLGRGVGWHDVAFALRLCLGFGGHLLGDLLAALLEPRNPLGGQLDPDGLAELVREPRRPVPPIAVLQCGAW